VLETIIVQYFWCPILLGIASLFLSDRKVAFFAVFIYFLTSLGFLYYLFEQFSLQVESYQFYVKKDWIASLGIYYELGIDKMSYSLILLSIFISYAMIYWQIFYERATAAVFLPLILLATGLLVGFFCAVDLVLFFVFFEALLIPMFMMIFIFGSDNRDYAAKKFFLFTFSGSLFFFLALCLLGTLHSIAPYSLVSFSLEQFSHAKSLLVLIALLLAMLVKLPTWPVHSWLFHAHVQAPTSGSVLLAALLLKVGGYAMMRVIAASIALPQMLELAPYLLYLGVFSIIYIGFVACMQEDFKKLIAYSSIAHMGFITAGLALFVLHPQGEYAARWALSGSYFQMISHGLISAALFFCAGMIYQRVPSRQIKDYGGLVSSMPTLTAFFLFFALANCGLPGTSGFVGEFFVIASAAQYSSTIAAMMGISLVLSAAFSLYLVKRIFFGPLKNPELTKCWDLERKEILLLSVLGAGVLILGLYPRVLLQSIV
jgi:NADH-quinone oxidoreductase subunit M